MRRRTVIITLLLILGAIVNVAVAWGCVLFVDLSQWAYGGYDEGWTMNLTVSVDDVSIWNGSRSQRFGRKRYVWRLTDFDEMPALRRTVASQRVPSWTAPSYLCAESERELPWHRRRHHFDDGSGYPLVSLTTSYNRYFDETVTLQTIGPKFGIELSGHADQWGWRLALPLRINTPGFIINTLFYAAILWLLFLAPFTARRMIRRRRGLCETCAYPVGASPVCTECGAAVRPKPND